MTIAENKKTGNQPQDQQNMHKNKLFFTDDELDLLDIKEPGQNAAGKNGSKLDQKQTAIIVLILTATASFALGMLAERSISGSNGVTSNAAASTNSAANLTVGQGASALGK